MKKIGIINYQYSTHNYGAVLQAAALHHFIRNELDLEPEHINYIPRNDLPKWYTKIKSRARELLMALKLKQKKIQL